MVQNWKELQGSIVNQKFQLRQYLGGSDVSAVFLINEGSQEKPQAALKLVPCDASNREAQLARLEAGKQLSHPHLLRIFDAGHCRLGETDFCFVLMEYAEEDLGQVLPQRALTLAEVHELTPPLLDALGYLHHQGFVHGHIKPSNILAIGNQVKLASDGLFRDGEAALLEHPSIYTPPEAKAGKLSTAADAWSLGITLLAALTGRPPVWQDPTQEVPVIPEDLPAPFAEVIRNSLRHDPRERWNVAEITACLRQKDAAVAPVAMAAPSSSDPRPAKAAAATRAGGSKRRLIVGSLSAAAALALAAGMGLFGTASHETSSSPSLTVQAAEEKIATTKAPSLPAVEETPGRRDGTSLPAAVPLSLRETRAGEGQASADIIHRVLPDVSQQALHTIHGTIRVKVRVHVDSSGNVTQAQFDSAGPSRYFATRALQAAKLWKFAPNSGDQRPDEWVLQFEYRNSGTSVTTQQTNL